MAINTQLEDERGNRIATLDSPAWLTHWLLLCAKTEGTSCLRFIDPYGDTLFNRLQMNVLVTELEAVGRTLTDEAVEHAYQQWLSRYEQLGQEFHEHALRYPKPTKSALLNHVESIRALAAAGAKPHHQYLRFIGD